MLRRSNYKDLEKWRATKNKQKRRYYRKTQGAENNGKRWLKKEINMVMDHNITDTELAFLIGRSVGAIQTKRNKIKNGSTKMSV